MTIGDPFLNNTSNSHSILTTNLTPNSSFSNNNINNNNNINGNTQFHSSPIPANYHKKINSNSNSPIISKSRCKRRSSDSEDSFKKIKFSSSSNDININNNNNNNIPVENLSLQNINLEEYPKFNHPEGGIIQFTPIGNIRTFITDNNIVKRIIEQRSTFDLNKTECGIDGYKLYLGSVSMDSSPSNEIETYMRVGYSNNNNYNNNSISNHYHNPIGCSGGCCSNFDYDCDSDLEDDDDYMS